MFGAINVAWCVKFCDFRDCGWVNDNRTCYSFSKVYIPKSSLGQGGVHGTGLDWTILWYHGKDFSLFFIFLILFSVILSALPCKLEFTRQWTCNIRLTWISSFFRENFWQWFQFFGFFCRLYFTLHFVLVEISNRREISTWYPNRSFDCWLTKKS